MDWMFYITVFIVLFSAVTVLLTIRYLLHRRLDRTEEKRQKEKAAQQIAESNSGL